MPASLFYLAYGSNLHPQRLALRIPASRFVGTTLLPGYTLRFHKRGGDGSGKCDALRTLEPGAVLPGAVFQMAAADKLLLDEIEGAGYRVDVHAVTVAGKQVRAFMYVAEPDYIEPQLQPFQWYKKLVYHGARFHCFDPQHLDLIHRIPAVEDVDVGRHSRNHRILELLTRD